MTNRWRPPDDALCVTSSAEFFAERDAADYDAGREAIATCRACPYRTICLQTAVAHNERYGIWGGAGTARRRALRRAFGTDRWHQALDAHFRRLDGEAALPGDDELLLVIGDGTTHGRRACFAKGCREDACAAAASLEGALAAAGRPRSLTSALATWSGGAA